MLRRLLLLTLLLPGLLSAQTQHDRLASRGQSTFDSLRNTQTVSMTGATPSVALGNVFKTANSSTTLITNFLGGSDSQQIWIICGDTQTSIANNSTIQTSTGSSVPCALLNNVFSFIFDASQTKWVQSGTGVGGGGGGGGGGSSGAPLVAQASSSGNSTSLNSTLLYTVPTAGMYIVYADLIVTNPDTSGTVTLNVSWNNGTTFAGLNSAAFPLTLAGEQAALSGNFITIDSGSSISYSTTLTGGTGAAQYTLNLRLFFLDGAGNIPAGPITCAQSPGLTGVIQANAGSCVTTGFPDVVDDGMGTVTLNGAIQLTNQSEFWQTFQADGNISNGHIVKFSGNVDHIVEATTSDLGPPSVIIGVARPVNGTGPLETVPAGTMVGVARWGSTASVSIDNLGSCVSQEPIIASASSAGFMHCTATPGTAQVIGVFINDVGNGDIDVYPQVRISASGGGSGTVAGTGTLGQKAVYTASTTVSPEPFFPGTSLTTLPTAGATYHIAPASGGGNDSNAGTLASPWLTPNHALNCGDVILAAAGTYAETNFRTGQWGVVSCPSGHNVAWLQCAVFDTCKISITGANDGMAPTRSYWGVQGWEITSSPGSGSQCFNAYVPNGTTSTHHIIFANNIANGCGNGGLTAGSFSSTVGTDYLAYIGNIAYNDAQNNANCYSGIDMVYPVNADKLPGTHIYIAGNFAFGNVDPNPCGGGLPSDGHGILLDSFSAGGPYTGQVVVDNNISVFNGGSGFQYFSSPNAPVYIRHNTFYGNETGSINANPCAELNINTAAQAQAFLNLIQASANTCFNGSTHFNEYALGSSFGNYTNLFSSNYTYSPGGFNVNAADGAQAVNNLPGVNPSFSNPVQPPAPSCAAFTSVPACMATVVANFTPTTAAAGSFGYQVPSNIPVYDPLYPQWLCYVTNMPAGLVTPGCMPNGTPSLAWDGSLLSLSGATVTNPGVFTNTQYNGYLESLINGCNPGTEYFANHSQFPTDAIVGCGSMPVGGTDQVNAVAGYANTLSSTAVGGYFQCRPLANNTFCDGSNSVVQDVAGLTTGVTLLGSDVNVYALNSPSAYTQTAGYNAALFAPNAGNYGPAFLATQFVGGTGRWGQILQSGDGASFTGIALGASMASGTNVYSQGIIMNYFDSGGTEHQVGVSQVNPNGTLYATANNFAVQESSSCVGVAAFDLLCPDSTAHRWRMNNNNGTETTIAGFSDNLGVFAAGGAISPASVNVSGLAASSSVCTDGSKNLTTSSCSGGLPTLPTSPNNVTQLLGSTPSGGVGGPAAWALPGVPVDATNPATLLATDRASYLNWTSGTALALPAVTTSFASNFPFVLKNTSTTLTITPNAGASDLIDGAASTTVIPNFASLVYQDSSSGPGHWFTVKFPTYQAFGSGCTAGLTWSTTTGLGCITTYNYAPSAPQTNTTDTWAANNATCVAAANCPFVTHVTFPAAATSGTLDGTHVASTVHWLMDVTGSNSPTFTYYLKACATANYTAGTFGTTLPVCSSGQVTLYQSASTAVNTGIISTSLQFDIFATVGGTAGTFVVARTGSGSVANTANGGSGVIACGATCTGGSWVIYPVIQYSAATAGNVVTTTGFYAPYIY